MHEACVVLSFYLKEWTGNETRCPNATIVEIPFTTTKRIVISSSPATVVCYTIEKEIDFVMPLLTGAY